MLTAVFKRFRFDSVAASSLCRFRFRDSGVGHVTLPIRQVAFNDQLALSLGVISQNYKTMDNTKIGVVGAGVSSPPASSALPVTRS